MFTGEYEKLNLFNEKREEAMELAKYYSERLPYAQITVTEVETNCIYSKN